MKFAFSMPKLSFFPAGNFLSGIRRFAVLQALFPEEKICGIEIADDSLRLLCLKKAAGKQYEVSAYLAEPLEKGVIEDGVVFKVDGLADALRKLSEKLTRAGYETKEFIAAISDKAVFSQPFPIPFALEEEMREQFVLTNLGRILPFEQKNIYFDFQPIRDAGNAKLNLFASGLKSAIDRWREAFFQAGLTLVALEPFSLALGRAMELPSGWAIVFSVYPKGFVSSVFFNQALYFRREVLLENSSSEIIVKEAERLKDFLVSEFGEEKIEMFLAQRPESFKSPSSFKDAPWKEIKAGANFVFTSDYGAVFGAAIRGLISRSKDTIISILPVGTELDYIKKKRKLFTLAIKRTTYSILAIAIALFVGLNTFLGFILDKEQERLEAKKKLPLTLDLHALYEQAKEFNSYTARVKNILSQSHSAADTLTTIGDLQLPGITFTKISVTNSAKPVINLSGIAATRESLILLKDHMSRNARFSGVEIPAQAFGAKTNISFNISFVYSP